MRSEKSKTGAKIKIELDNASAINEVFSVTSILLKKKKHNCNYYLYIKTCFIIQIKQPKTLEKVEITLADCLACSGCITSAESVLITQQSQNELLRIFQEKLAQQVKISFLKYYFLSFS